MTFAHCSNPCDFNRFLESLEKTSHDPWFPWRWLVFHRSIPYRSEHWTWIFGRWKNQAIYIYTDFGLAVFNLYKAQPGSPFYSVYLFNLYCNLVLDELLLELLQELFSVDNWVMRPAVNCSDTNVDRLIRFIAHRVSRSSSELHTACYLCMWWIQVVFVGGYYHRPQWTTNHFNKIFSSTVFTNKFKR